ncbi:MAG: DUF4337 domain-containing protein [Candidatus Eremiobacteraeota bacterium]|nr:DUF4337 domain-containing protein [Candidatus Eremiobacteraeota bacterium]
MSSPHKAFDEAAERHEHLEKRHDRLVPLAAAIIAVLAALGTLFSHHQSIRALSIKNEAILLQSKAADQYNYYEAKRLKATVYSALLASGNVRDAAARDTFRKEADHESTSSLAILNAARDLERRADERSVRSEDIMKSFETVGTATTLLEIAIVFVSISALSETRLLLYLGTAFSAAGVLLAVFGYFQGH